MRKAAVKKQAEKKVQPVANVQWVPRETLRANDYNPNHVAPPELDLLRISILSNGWTQPIVARPDGEIVDGYHRWLISADPDIAAMTDGLLPVSYLEPSSPADQMMATIRHNRARGSHHVLRMASIVRSILDVSGLSKEELMTALQMEEEEVERLYDTRGMTGRGSKDEFNKGWVPE